ncbi:MAG: hypothetical protein EA379_00540 [Phycisphaerales bacterium]|nr:MAG: hypothetical protein EA379_00540 [Phycisphaerales bacterium]
MARKRNTGLVAINLVLLCVLALVTIAPGASAQRDRVRGDYTMVSGRIQGSVESAIYIVDATNLELVAVRWDRSRRNLAPVGFRSLSTDFDRVGGQGR